MTPATITRKGAPASGDPRDPKTTTLADVTHDDMRLVGSNATLDLATSVLNCKPTRTIDGASSLTVTCADPDLKILHSRAFYDDDPAKLNSLATVDNLIFALAGVNLQTARKTVLTLEDETVNRLRQFHGSLTMVRGEVTRAQFFKRLCDDAGVDFFCPELDDKQKIAKPDNREDPATRNRNRRPGIAAHADITVKDEQADAEQRENIETALDKARELQAGELATQALMVAGIGESNFRKSAVDQVTGTHKGVWQSNQIPPGQVATQAHHFLLGGRSFRAGGAIGMAKEHPTLTPGTIALLVEISDASNAEFYDQWLPEAKRMIAAYTGDDNGVLDGTITKTVDKPYQFRRKRNETSWDCMRRLAKEVEGWYLFVVAGTVYFCSGDYLRAGKPRMLVTPGADGIDEVTFNYMTSPKHDDTISVVCHMRRWQAPPGSIVDVAGYGPVDGRWLVQEIARDKLTSTVTRVTLARPQKKGLEPAPQTRTVTSSGRAKVTGNRVAGGSVRDQVVAAAKHAAELSANDPSYYFYSLPGRWKTDLFERDAPGERSDCSSFVIQCYAKVLGYDDLPSGMRYQGNTATLASYGRKTSDPKPGDICLYGFGPGYRHVELVVGDDKTIGHGSAPVNYDTPRGLSGFAGFWTFDFLDDTSLAGGESAASEHPRT